MTTLRIATRRSALALAQARRAAAQIGSALRVATEILPLETSGDRLAQAPLAQIGGKGLFAKELEEALLAKRADVAVHSAKDLPAQTPAGLVLAAFPDAADPRDALVARERGARLVELRRGARVGTGSARRAAQLRRLRPDLEILPLRGNVDTRLRKLEEGGLDALILACAGLERLGREARIDERVAPELLLPAVNQGVIALEARAGDALARELAQLTSTATGVRVAAERAFLAGIGGDCNVPLAALAEPGEGGRLRLRALLAAPDGSRIARHAADAPVADAARLGSEAAHAVLAAGGAEILAALRTPEQDGAPAEREGSA